MEAGASVVLIASEALAESGGSPLRQALARQQPWSEMPIVLFGGGFEDAASGATELLGTRAQIMLLERPLGIASSEPRLMQRIDTRHPHRRPSPSLTAAVV